jgi:hypothetical protein
MCQQFDMFEAMRYVCVLLSIAATLAEGEMREAGGMAGERQLVRATEVNTASLDAAIFGEAMLLAAIKMRITIAEEKSRISGSVASSRRGGEEGPVIQR